MKSPSSDLFSPASNYSQLSPTHKRIGFREGFDFQSFLKRVKKK